MTAVQQQINLYQPVFRRQVVVFSAVTLLKIAAMVLLLLMIILGHARWTLANMTATARTLDSQVATLNAQTQKLDKNRTGSETGSLDNEIEQLQEDIRQRNQLLTQFGELLARRGNGFAARFQVLAEEHVPGLWLEGVTVNDAGRIELRGVTLDARLVPTYLQHLEHRKNLSATPFETVSMDREDPKKPQIRFVLRNFKGQPAWN
jgi:cell division protein FtsB